MGSIISNIKDLINNFSIPNLRKKFAYLITIFHKDKTSEAIENTLRDRFSYYVTDNLKGISAEKFRNHIFAKLNTIDAKNEGFSEEEISKQRDMTLKFTWGHNHDFGDFILTGPTSESYIRKLAYFIKRFPVSIEDFQKSTVFDIGCWTGGTSLALGTISKKVVAIEEVRKYASMVNFLAKSFGVDDKVEALPISLYNCDSKEFYSKFDIVYFPGVIYHLSDPVLAFRILYNSLKTGGAILVESEGINTRKPICVFEGSGIYHLDSIKSTRRKGWNWFIPSPSALSRMMIEAGFEDVEVEWHDVYGRIYAFGKKNNQKAICKAGLSVPSIK